MRVISGDFKGRTLKTVTNKLTRPTADKVKEALFNIIGPYFNGGHALDLFAGSGGLGIEALSRGIDHVIFIDQQRQAIDVIKQNLKELKLSKRAEVYQTDAFRSLKVLGKRQKKFDYIFLDPPYERNVFQQIIEETVQRGIVTEETLIICEHEKNQQLPDRVSFFHKIRTESYGSSVGLSLYHRKVETNE